MIFHILLNFWRGLEHCQSWSILISSMSIVWHIWVHILDLPFDVPYSSKFLKKARALSTLVNLDLNHVHCLASWAQLLDIFMILHILANFWRGLEHCQSWSIWDLNHVHCLASLGHIPDMFMIFHILANLWRGLDNDQSWLIWISIMSIVWHLWAHILDLFHDFSYSSKFLKRARQWPKLVNFGSQSCPLFGIFGPSF